ncbi:MAG: 50S ribosomal protein L29 [Chlamydiia bacterium]|nr:50S ribosomal protein L29 [Chlamydiia bacterium]
MLKASELKNQSTEELEGMYEDLCRDIFELTSELRVSRKLEKPHELKEKKKDRARILTVLRQKSDEGSTK